MAEGGHLEFQDGLSLRCKTTQYFLCMNVFHLVSLEIKTKTTC